VDTACSKIFSAEETALRLLEKLSWNQGVMVNIIEGRWVIVFVFYSEWSNKPSSIISDATIESVQEVCEEPEHNFYVFSQDSYVCIAVVP